VSKVTTGGIEVALGEGAVGFIRKLDLSRDRSEQRPDRFAVGEKVDALVMSVDRSSRRISLSVKAKEVREEKEAMAQYGSSDSGASLGDILGAALNKASVNQGDKPAEADEAPKADAAEADEAPEAEAADAEEAPAAAEAEAEAESADEPAAEDTGGEDEGKDAKAEK
jgi:small subunit ribosomal protein S1